MTNKQITRERLAQLAFCNSPELPQTVNDNGKRKQWVGIGWIDEGPTNGTEEAVIIEIRSKPNKRNAASNMKKDTEVMSTEEAKAWIQSPEGIAAMDKAIKDAQKAIEELNKPVRLPGCTCCPIHSRVYR
jgi:hypothetical protein